MDSAANDLRDEIIEVLTSEMGRIRDKLKEIRTQISETQAMVEREQQRNSDIATQLRTIQDNLDTVPRQDIRARYDEAVDARFRLATMRGQLEKFESYRDHLEDEQSFLSQLRGRIEGIEALPDSDDAGDTGGRGSVNIVRIVQAQEDERQRLARQMHDGPAQSLTNFILQAEICQRLFDRNPDRAAEELTNLKSAASITFQKVRDFIFDLRPMMLDDLGVVPTVRRYVDSFKEKNDIETTLEITGDERRLDPHLEVMLFRGIQDLMSYARDYSTPSNMFIKLNMGNEKINVVVEDNGRTFDSEAIYASEDYHSEDPRIQGLITLKEKFELVSGSMSVTSDENNGTIVRLELPAEKTGR